MNRQPVLTDAELRLRPACLPQDIELALPWYSDPEVMLFSEGDASASYDAEMIGRMYEYLANSGELYIIEVLERGQWLPIGDVTLAPDTLPIVIGLAEYRSRGLGRRVIRLLISRASELGWSRMEIKKIGLNNQRSRRMFESLGFVQTGEVFEEDGQPCCRFVRPL